MYLKWLIVINGFVLASKPTPHSYPSGRGSKSESRGLPWQMDIFIHPSGTPYLLYVSPRLQINLSIFRNLIILWSFPNLPSSFSFIGREHSTQVCGSGISRVEMPIILYIVASFKGKANPRVWRHEIMERDSLGGEFDMTTVPPRSRCLHNGSAFRLIVLARRSEDRWFSKSVGNT